MFFSVILPIYNVEKYLCDCIDSILGQDFEDYELILVDDGSKDDSGRICDAYAQKDSRIKVIHKENEGLSAARNCGTDVASGEYIVYIDSDDFVTSSSFLTDIYNKVQATNSDIVLYKFAKFYDDTHQLADCTFSLNIIDGITDSDELWYQLVRYDAYYGMAWIKAFRKELVVSGQISFEKGLLGEDMDWYFGVVLQAKTVSAIDRAYIAYRQRSGSITSSLRLKNLSDFIYIIEKWNKKILTAEIGDKKKAALMGAIAKYYTNLLITYCRVRDSGKKEYINRIKALSWLLDYGISKRPNQIRKMYKISGFTGTVCALSILDRMRRWK